VLHLSYTSASSKLALADLSHTLCSSENLLFKWNTSLRTWTKCLHYSWGLFLKAAVYFKLNVVNHRMKRKYLKWQKHALTPYLSNLPQSEKVNKHQSTLGLVVFI
jgi:hypothetical protein